jgi:ferredoxin
MKRRDRDDAFRREEAELTRRTQVDAFAEEPAAVPREAVADVPSLCTGCGRTQTIRHGWTPLTKNADDLLSGTARLQCGACAHVVVVPEEAALRLRRAIAEEYRARMEAVAPKRRDTDGRRTRGAG